MVVQPWQRVKALLLNGSLSCDDRLYLLRATLVHVQTHNHPIDVLLSHWFLLDHDVSKLRLSLPDDGSKRNAVPRVQVDQALVHRLSQRGIQRVSIQTGDRGRLTKVQLLSHVTEALPARQLGFGWRVG